MSLIASQEKIIEYPDGERVVGLYALEWKDFDKYVSFLTKSSWAIGVISKRDKFISETNIEHLYNASQYLIDESSGIDINWIKISETLCLLGDIVVKTIGSYDDREREVNLIYASQLQSLLHSS